MQLITARVLRLENGARAKPHLRLDIQVKNIAHVKKVIVHWSVTDAIWHQSQAAYHYPSGRSYERWLADIALRLPGDSCRSVKSIRVKLEYRVAERVFWDHGGNCGYLVKTTGELLTGPDIHVTVLDHPPERTSTFPTITVAVNPAIDAQRLFVRWSTDNWLSFHQRMLSLLAAKNSSDDFLAGTEPAGTGGPQLWTARINPYNSLQLQYAICCATVQGELWDNNLGLNYHIHHQGLKVMTLNLHCMQEADQYAKFKQIAMAIRDKRIDVACLQEVAEDWNDGNGNSQSNAAKILQVLLADMGLTYHLHSEWSHIGFSVYLEGCAILSRQPFLKTDSMYLSEDTDVHNIHSRKAVMGRIQCSGIGVVDIYSLHLSWWEKGLSQQLDALFKWVVNTARETGDTATLLCGDFNAKAGSPGYLQVIDSDEYEDQFLKTTSPIMFSCLASGRNIGRRDLLLAHDQRIDYIFAFKNNRLRPVFAERLFDGHQYRKVSDHPGYLVEFKGVNHII